MLIVDKHFKIIKDTYNLDDGNTIVSEEVIKTFSASEITKDVYKRQALMILPLYNLNLTSPVTYSCVDSTKAWIASRSGVNHFPSYTTLSLIHI